MKLLTLVVGLVALEVIGFRMPSVFDVDPFLSGLICGTVAGAFGVLTMQGAYQ